MSGAIYHEVNGLVFGKKPDTPYAFGLISADGLEDLDVTDGLLGRSGFDGRGIAPMWAESTGWVTEVEIYGATPDEWAAQRDLLRALTTPILDRTAEMAYDMVYGEEDVRTRFCRPSRRIIPTNEQYLVRRVIQAQIAWTGNDPFTYGPETSSAALDRGDAYVYESTGWAPSQRWSWVVTGPVVRPRLRLQVTGFDDVLLRFDDTVATGEELVVTSTPHGLVTTLDGVNVYGQFDGGTAPTVPGFFSVPPGEQQVSFGGDSGAGTSVFTWRTAMI